MDIIELTSKNSKEYFNSSPVTSSYATWNVVVISEKEFNTEKDKIATLPNVIVYHDIDSMYILGLYTALVKNKGYIEHATVNPDLVLSYKYLYVYTDKKLD